jgi:hypothetical protein
VGRLAVAFLVSTALISPATAQSFNSLPIPTIPVSQLPVAGTLTGSELFYVVQGGVSKSTTFSSFAAGYLPLTGGTLTGPLIIHSTLDVESNPVLVVGLNPIAFFGATKNVNTAGVALEGASFQVTDTAGWIGTGQNNFIEGIRTGAVLSNNSTLGSAYGALFAANDQTATSHFNLFAAEGGVFNYTENAPATSSLNCSSSCILSAAFLGGTGGSKLVDAIFLVNPYAGTSSAQSGFLAAGNGLSYAAFADISTTAAYGLDMAFAIHSTGAIHLNNNESIVWDSAPHITQYFSLFVDPNGNLNVGRGNTAVVLSTVTSCSGHPTGTLWNNAGVVNVCP